MEDRIKAAAREALSLTREQVAAGTAAMAGPLSRLGGSAAALEVAANVASALHLHIALGEELPSSMAVRDALLHRRSAFPGGAWARLTDAEIDAVSAEAAQAWERAIRVARAA